MSEYVLFQRYMIRVTHLATNKSVSFYAFLTNFSDSFKGSYKTQTVYGRMDPIVNYQGTTRKISFSFTAPAKDVEEGQRNLYKLQRLIQFQYCFTNPII